MTEVLALVAILVAVATLGVMFYLDRKRNPRREFTYFMRASPLVSTKVRGLDKLTVAYDGSPLTHPYLFSMQLASTGRADISSSSFDGQNPILIELNVPILGEIEQTPSTETVGARLEFVEGKSFIKLSPSLLPKGFSIRASYLCDGKPNVQPKIELTDIPTRTSFQTSTVARWPRTTLAVSLFAITSIAAVLSFLSDLGVWR